LKYILLDKLEKYNEIYSFIKIRNSIEIYPSRQIKKYDSVPD